MWKCEKCGGDLLGPIEWGEENKFAKSDTLAKITDAILCPKCGYSNFPESDLERIEGGRDDMTFSEYWGTDSEEGEGDNILDLPMDSLDYSDYGE